MSETGTIERLRVYRKTYIAMLVSSILSLIASLLLSIDAVKLAAAPSGKLSCDINAVLSCGKVAKSWQSELLGFPNAFIGLIGYYLRFFAISRLDASIYAPLSYFGIVMSYIYGIFLNNDKISMQKIIGTLCIVFTNLYILYSGVQK
jgi:uncharacterized membrane protein